jgi:MFS family permease
MSKASSAPIGYLRLLRQNQTYRRIWMGNVVSLAGDWFTSIALFAMLLELTGKAEAVGLVLVARFLPALLFSPLAGALADRLPRRAIMVACDLMRAVVVLGFLLVRDRGDVPLAYGITFLQLTLAVFFDPAQQATVGRIVTREQIVTANALQGITWSVMLSLGALAGGVFAETFGRRAAFVLNAATYLLSAFFISRADVPGHEPRPQAPNLLAALGLTDLAEGARFVAREPGVRLMLFAKAGWSLAGGGALMLYTVFGERVFPIGKGAASGIGLLYAARGVGALLGPTAARVWKGDSEPALERAIGFGFPLMVAAYLLLAGAPSIGVAVAAVVLAHIAASVIWTFSTSLLNLRVPDRLKGRAFALDAAITTVSLIASTLATAWGLDRAGLSPRAVMAALALVGIVPAIAWRLLPRAPAAAVGREGVSARSRAVEG